MTCHESISYSLTPVDLKQERELAILLAKWDYSGVAKSCNVEQTNCSEPWAIPENGEN